MDIDQNVTVHKPDIDLAEAFKNNSQHKVEWIVRPQGDTIIRLCLEYQWANPILTLRKHY